jgi:hypothetical protein
VSLQIWLPSSAEHGDRKLVSGVDTSREIVDRCRVCQEFVVFEGEHPRTMEMHLRRCLRANHERVMAERERRLRRGEVRPRARARPLTVRADGHPAAKPRTEDG